MGSWVEGSHPASCSLGRPYSCSKTQLAPRSLVSVCKVVSSLWVPTGTRQIQVITTHVRKEKTWLKFHRVYIQVQDNKQVFKKHLDFLQSAQTSQRRKNQTSDSLRCTTFAAASEDPWWWMNPRWMGLQPYQQTQTDATHMVIIPVGLLQQMGFHQVFSSRIQIDACLASPEIFSLLKFKSSSHFTPLKGYDLCHGELSSPWCNCFNFWELSKWTDLHQHNWQEGKPKFSRRSAVLSLH